MSGRATDLAKLANRIKFSPVTIHNAISVSAESAEIDTTDFNAIILEIFTTLSKSWTVSLTGSLISGGTFSDVYDNGTLVSYETTSSKMIIVKTLPPFIKIKATENADGGKCTIKYKLINA